MRFSTLLLVFTAAVAAAAEPEIEFPTGRLVEDVACAADPSQTYALYLPSSYNQNRKWPVLLVFDPRGRSVMAAELFVDAAEQYGWILLSSNDTRSDTSSEPNSRAVNAMWPELESRYSVDRRRIYAAGMSGTVYLAHLLGRQTGELAGVVTAGGRNLPEAIGDSDFAWFGAVGDTDFNNIEMRRLAEHLATRGSPYRLEVFEGPHGWMPEPLARQAVEWLELQAMRTGSRAVDSELAAGLFGADMAGAEAAPDELSALRRYRAIERGYEGLADVSPAVERAAALDKSHAVKQARKEEKRWDDYELRYQARLASVVSRVSNSSEPVSANRLMRDLDIASLQRSAKGDGIKAVTAQRILNTVSTNLGFYLWRELQQSGRDDRAAAVLEVVAEIRGDSPTLCYNLACALARAGRKSAAIDALQRAVAAGWTDVDHLESDPDLESIRDDEGYRKLVEGLRAEAGE